jgi:hypothetical protein
MTSQFHSYFCLHLHFVFYGLVCVKSLLETEANMITLAAKEVVSHNSQLTTIKKYLVMYE